MRHRGSLSCLYGNELQAQMQEHMVDNQRNPEKMQRLFHKESVKYASHMEN